MPSQSYGKSQASYYLDTICSNSDQAYRFAYACVLEKQEAVLTLEKAYQDLLENPSTPDHQEIIPIVARVWDVVDKDKDHKANNDDHKVFKNLFGNMQLEQRAVLTLIDYFGLETKVAARVLSKNLNEIKILICDARKIFIESSF